MALDSQIKGYLRERMRRADTVLFTGAGFSRAVRNRAGNPMPLGHELRPLLWAICYPSETFSENSRLEDLFEIARSKNPKGLTDLLRLHLSVDTESIPPYYGDFFNLPWHRSYTLNIDDLPSAVSRKYTLRRQLATTSAISWTERSYEGNIATTLEVIHLNGILDEAPDQITFSPTQYAERLAGQEPLYALCAADVLSRPVIFVGTPLDEAPLWQHVHMRRKGPRTRGEFRRQSYIVTPSLDRARKDLLEREFHVAHIPLDLEEFAQELIEATRDSFEEGFQLLKTTAIDSRITTVPLAQDLAAAASPGQPDYLFGRAPAWGDVRDGVAALRDCDGELFRIVADELQAIPNERASIMVSGTAGVGKSTAMMSLALRFAADNRAVGWLDSSIDMSPIDLRTSMCATGHPDVLIIDEADRYGNELPALVSDLAAGPGKPVIVISMRSGRGADRFFDRAESMRMLVREYLIPHLADRDIGALLDTLDTHNRLGVLKGKARSVQFAIFKEGAGRQLIVAMLEATSGRNFQELMISEASELDSSPQDLYCLVAVASSLRFGLTRDELLLAVDDASNATLGSIDSLQKRHLIYADRHGELHVRHRTIAEVLTKWLAAENRLAGIVRGLAVAAASKVMTGMRQNHKHYRRVRAIMQHDWLVTQIGVREARYVYEELEPFLTWAHHYWLQRGSFELEHGELYHAENFLNQAYGLDPDDLLVQTEYAYLQLKLAVLEPASAESRRLRDEGFGLLKHAIRLRQGAEPHQFHIYGKQALEWLRRGDVTAQEREKLLLDVIEQVEAGRKAHPRNLLLRELFVSVQNERLGVSDFESDRR